MLAIIRLFLMAIFFILSSVFLLSYLIVRPFRRNNVKVVANVYGWFIRFLGIKVEIRGLENVKDHPVVYIGNHQNTYDIFTVANAVRKNTVSVGKKSLKWAPFFGQVYWLSGNILIDRGNRTKAHGTIGQAAAKIKDKKISVWLFPEGTRSNGRGLLKFKSGAFYTAQMAGVPIVPVVISTTHNQIKLNRWNNGKYIIEYLPEIMIENDDKVTIRDAANNAHEQMKVKLAELDAELVDVNAFDKK
ncbi:1-acylglycerol-3-phosphate O-acyltransferase [Psychrosphaera sp. F3M07]|uniref:1-acylglycerol-3-phosphate O-acyltransferase n=1 Tax=Psychrosphaera sp. F3M07 TaxID=2841560 RepID=UPI001C08CCEA|nr:1-acylglycerol-3-phosphate O-acyltransferase [Psychrosphaera sp. F3M07]